MKQMVPKRNHIQLHLQKNKKWAVGSYCQETNFEVRKCNEYQKIKKASGTCQKSGPRVKTLTHQKSKKARALRLTSGYCLTWDALLVYSHRSHFNVSLPKSPGTAYGRHTLMASLIGCGRFNISKVKEASDC